MKAIVKSFIYGVGIGTIISFFNYLFHGLTSISVFTLGTVGLCSGLIGVVSVVLFDLLSLEYRLSFILHYVMTLLIIIVMNMVNGWNAYLLSLKSLINFTIIYVIVWLVEIWMNHNKVNRINEKLQARKKR